MDNDVIVKSIEKLISLVQGHEKILGELTLRISSIENNLKLVTINSNADSDLYEYMMEEKDKLSVENVITNKELIESQKKFFEKISNFSK